MFYPLYPISNRSKLVNYLNSYITLVCEVATYYDIDLKSSEFQCDHIGIQMTGADDFDRASELLSKYSTILSTNVIHERRNRVFELHEEVAVEGIVLPKVELFEPKPGVPLKALKLGVEHIAFYTCEYDALLQKLADHPEWVDKSLEFEDGSKFFKTKLINLVEIEFRNDRLGG